MHEKALPARLETTRKRPVGFPCQQAETDPSSSAEITPHPREWSHRNIRKSTARTLPYGQSRRVKRSHFRCLYYTTFLSKFQFDLILYPKATLSPVESFLKQQYRLRLQRLLIRPLFWVNFL